MPDGLDAIFAKPGICSLIKSEKYVVSYPYLVGFMDCTLLV